MINYIFIAVNKFLQYALIFDQLNYSPFKQYLKKKVSYLSPIHIFLYIFGTNPTYNRKIVKPLHYQEILPFFTISIVQKTFKLKCAYCFLSILYQYCSIN